MFLLFLTLVPFSSLCKIKAESNVSAIPSGHSYYKCPYFLIPCNTTNKCISRLCDGVNDCFENSDEPNWCFDHDNCYTEVRNCYQLCLGKPGYYRCECYNGYRLNTTSYICEDIDECNEMDDVCNGQMCANLIGDYKCGALNGNINESNSSPIVLYADSFRMSTLNVSTYKKYAMQGNIILESAYIVSFDINWAENYIIFINFNASINSIEALELFRGYPSRFPKRTSLLPTTNTIMGITLDWVHNLAYYYNRSDYTIRVISVNQPNISAVVIRNSLNIPDCINLNINESRIIWINNRSNIEMSSQDGSGRKILISNLQWPTGLTIDAESKLIYWLQSDWHLNYHSIHSCDYSGNNRKFTFSSNKYLGASSKLYFFDGYLYWISRQVNSIIRLSLQSYNVSNVMDMFNEKIMDFKVGHSKHQSPSHNRCLAHKCPYICVPHNTTCYTCLCPDNSYFDENNMICIYFNMRQSPQTAQFKPICAKGSNIY